MISTTPDRDGRPSPEALLKVAAQEGRGKLKIFLGAAPGVGKTYAMLLGAQRLQAEGLDVAIGLVETHGRVETAELLNKLEVLPRRPMTYRGRTLMEFDVDGAIARGPKLLIVDELAHSNPPDSRHPKRFLDIKDVLDAGIDVWTALNIQHLESLSDVVSRITGVKVRETVPDTVIELADEVVVVDITPTELIQRLKEGKVYLPENARRAIDKFFTASNLTALRELALRRTADQVDDQMVAYLRQNAIEGPWPTAERLLVCVGGDALSATVVREAARMATGLKAGWVAVHLERAEGASGGTPAAALADENMRLAERLGADTAHLVGADLPAEVLKYAKRENITQIFCGRSRSTLLSRILGRSLSDEIVIRAKDIAVHIVAGKVEASPPRAGWTAIRAFSSKSIVIAAVAVALAVLAGQLLARGLELPNLSMVFLTAVLVCAVSVGTASAIWAALLSFFAYNFFFIEPLYSFTVAKPHELFALLMFLLVAILTGGLAGRVREQSNAASRRAEQTRALYDFTRKLSSTAKLDDVLWAVSAQTAQTVKGRAIVLLADAGALSISSGWPPEDRLGPGEWAAARSAFETQQTTGWRSNTLPNAQFQFRPLKTSRGGIIGVVGLHPDNFRVALALETERMLEALLDQAALAIERTMLVDETAHAQAVAASEKLRSALLSSLSHDLRTPLSSILGSVTTIRSFGAQLPETERDDLLSAIEEEARRLQRFVANLLDMTRLEAGAIEVRRDWVDISDTVRAAVDRVHKAFDQRHVEVTIEPGLPLVRGDASLIEQMIFNLLDNANKYARRETPIAVHVRRDGAQVVLTVRDQGLGIAKEDLDRVFEKFYRSQSHDGRSAGTGLGLAICRGIATAMGGTIRAESPAKDGRGTRMVVRLPVAEAAVERDMTATGAGPDRNDTADADLGGRR